MTDSPFYTVDLCKMCNLSWRDHINRGIQRARDEISNEYAYNHEQVPGGVWYNVEPRITLEDCIELLKIANRGPMGPQGDTGAKGDKGASFNCTLA